MNYMEQVAVMLGVKLGEEIRINDKNERYQLTEQGICCKSGAEWILNPEIKNNILSGRSVVKEAPFKPQNDEIFYYVNTNGEIKCEIFNEKDPFALGQLIIGNCFKSKRGGKGKKVSYFYFFKDIVKCNSNFCDHASHLPFKVIILLNVNHQISFKYVERVEKSKDC